MQILFAAQSNKRALQVDGSVAFATLLPAIKNKFTRVNLSYLGAVLLAFGCYFISNTLITP